MPTNESVDVDRCWAELRGEWSLWFPDITRPCDQPGIPPLYLCLEHLAEIAPKEPDGDHPQS